MSSRLRTGVLAVIACAGAALAQTSNDNQNTQIGVRSVPPRKMSGLGGVKSQPGVKSAAPRGFSTPMLLPTAPPRQAPPGAQRPPASRPVPMRPGFSRPVTGDGYPAPYVSPYRHVPVVSDGLTVAGVYRDGNFTLAFRTGGLTRIPVPHDGCIVPVYTGGCAVLPYAGLGSIFSTGSYFSSGYYSGWDGAAWVPAEEPRPVIGTVEYTPAAGDSSPPPAPMTPMEQAAAMLRYGDAKAAVAAYKKHLKEYPNDALAMRSLGMSLIDAGQTGDGVAIIGMAYTMDSTLAAEVVPVDTFGKIAHFRSNLNRVSSYANREKSASAWLTLAVLMQGEGRAKQALAMLGRARDSGLDEQTFLDMTIALGGDPAAAGAPR